MSLIRPELSAALARRKEPLLGTAIALLGAWLIWRGDHRADAVLQGVGVVVVGVGLAIVLASWRRSRFRQPGTGQGLVLVTERQITYMGPFQGGSVRLEGLTRIELRDTIELGRVWVLKHEDGPPVLIPTNARGAELLFDALSALPDLDGKRLLQALERQGGARQVVWRRGRDDRLLT